MRASPLVRTWCVQVLFQPRSRLHPWWLSTAHDAGARARANTNQSEGSILNSIANNKPPTRALDATAWSSRWPNRWPSRWPSRCAKPVARSKAKGAPKKTAERKVESPARPKKVKKVADAEQAAAVRVPATPLSDGSGSCRRCGR